MNKVLLGIVGILVVLFFTGCVGMKVSPTVPAVPKVEVTLENCEPHTCVGMVQWLNNKTDYKDLPEAEIKRAGKLTVMLEPGEYAITHYYPRYEVKMDNGKTLVIGSKIIDFREVVITRSVTLSFGCEWRMEGAV